MRLALALLIGMLLVGFSYDIGDDNMDPWDEWVQNQTAQTQRETERLRERQLLGLKAEFSASMTDLRMHWGRDKVRERKAKVDRARRLCSRIMALEDHDRGVWFDKYMSLSRLSDALENTR